ncbi:phytanoyl-CoA dioxygenase family protein [Nocardia sp. NEAU-G5]|uniref:Phytanoyl-CoA dioxygenase family protein n=1 Tax=Nocardia albiluteola TaxID=2842303 RepID=A0ABS6BCY9_9NOCA|nr:phytanoyl-CoA dioxygenase family protein [Nocardia albiluteola]MBU3068165.1 phytanoyl-CoA dioxygenase family protein [Nocardia albiluteola]
MTDTTPRTTPYTVDEQYVTAFREYGFTHVPGLIPADEVAQWRETALNTIEEDGRRAGMGGGRTALQTTTDPWWKHDSLRDLVRHPRVGAVAEQLAGTPMRVWSGQAYAKRPHDEVPTIWHEDLTLTPLDSPMNVNAWVALVDVPVERGCLIFLPNSHKRPGPHRSEMSEVKNNPTTYMFAQWPELEWYPRVTVPVRAGDVTFHQSLVGHSSWGNVSDETRLAFIISYTGAEAIFQPRPGHNRMDPDLVVGEQLPGHRYPRISDFA